jgi:SAM-dependent methyltransferase
MKRYLLIGCGDARDKRVAFPSDAEVGQGSPEPDFSGGELVTLDADPEVGADIVHDLDVLPYPLDDDAFDEIHAYEVLEHCGTQGDAKFFFGQFRELWRALKPGGYLMISVPMWNDAIAWAVPDHRRVLPEGAFGFLDAEYEQQHAGKRGVGSYKRLRGDMNLKPLFKQETETQLFVVMRAIK